MTEVVDVYRSNKSTKGPRLFRRVLPPFLAPLIIPIAFSLTYVTKFSSDLTASYILQPQAPRLTYRFSASEASAPLGGVASQASNMLSKLFALNAYAVLAAVA